MLYSYLKPSSIVDLLKMYQLVKIDSILNKYSKDANSIDEIMDQTETRRNVEVFVCAKSIVAKKVKLRRQKMKASKRLKAEKLKRQKAGAGTGIKILTPNKLLTRLPLYFHK